VAPRFLWMFGRPKMEWTAGLCYNSPGSTQGRALRRIVYDPEENDVMRLIGALVLLCVPVGARAQGDPFSGPNQFPQFRNLSALGGCSYGVDEKGYFSLSGPTAFSTPVAPTMGRGQFRFAIGRTSFSSPPSVHSSRTNGTAFIAYGFTLGPFNITLSDLFKSNQFDQAYNLQIQYISPHNGRL